MAPLIVLLMAATPYARALDAYRNGNVEQALSLFAEARAATPTSAAVLTDYGFVLMQADRGDEAATAFREAIAAAPARVYAYLHLAELARDRGTDLDVVDRVLVSGEGRVPRRFLASLVLARADLAVAREDLAAARALLDRTVALPRLIAAQRRQRADIIARMDQHIALSPYDTWPRATPSDEEARTLATARTTFTATRYTDARTTAIALWHAKPTWRAPLVLAAECAERLGLYETAAEDYERLVRLEPYDANAWRRLGLLLEAHGGAAENARAVEALERAVALEPLLVDAKLALGRVLIRARRTDDAARIYDELRGLAGVDVPTSINTEARADSTQLRAEVSALERTFDEGCETPPAEACVNARARLNELIATTPTALAVQRLYAHVYGEAHASAMQAFAEDKDALFELAQDTGARVLLERAARLGHVTAALQLAELDAKTGDTEKTRQRLADYVALAGQTADAARLLELKPRTARPAPPRSCSGDDALAFATSRERAGAVTEAFACYRSLSATNAVAADRFARWIARAPSLSSADRATLLSAAATPAIDLALAMHDPNERARLAHFVAVAGEDDVDLARARVLLAAHERANEQRTNLFIALAVLAVLIGAWVVVRRRLQKTVAAAVRAEPSLHRIVLAEISKLRHEELKHRASSLGLAATIDLTALYDVLMRPAPVSAAIAGTYARLQAAARAIGITLVPLQREPVFSALHADLELAERLPNRDELARIGRRLVEQHGPALQALLEHGPRCTIDVEAVAAWIQRVRAETGSTLVAEVQAERVSFATTREDLDVVALNLLRNAVAATKNGRVRVRVCSETSATGRVLSVIEIADDAAAPLSVDTIAERPMDRGLGLVREIVRAWHGHLRVLPSEDSGYSKRVGACFPS